MKIPVSKVFPNPNQPRTVFDADELESLAQSIMENDLIQPIVVEQDGDGNYFLIDGERRWRAHQLAGLDEIEAVIEEPTGKFDALAMLEARGYGKKARDLPAATRQAARATCKDCPLYAEASAVMCRECPLPDFLKRLGE